MDMSLQKRLGSGRRALLVGLGVLGCCLLADLIQADVSSAAYKPPAGVPTAGLNCVALDGKVDGRGSTLQTVLQQTFAASYRDSFCGATTNSPEDEAGNTMIGYNYAAAETAGATGSGAGLKATSCRTDAFAGTDTPYTQEQLEQLDAAPGAETTPAECAIKFTPPFGPKAPFPAASDVSAPVMSFPVAGSAVAIAVNLTGGSPAICAKAVPTALSFTAKEVSRIFGGDAATWGDAELQATNPILKTDECTGAITRVVRPDSSGTTSIFKQYLIRADNARTGQKCGVVSGKLEPWQAYFATNTLWPGKQNKAEEGTCTTILTGAKSGNPEEIATVKANPGGVGYADLPQETGNAGIITATVQNEVQTSFQAPAAGKGANCNVGVVSLPQDGSAEGAVGLDTKDDWSTNNEEKNGAENHQNITFVGAKYPICGITFDLVYSGLDNNKGENNAITPLTADQRRTLYGYFSYVETTAAQTLGAQNDYAALPQPWVSTIREGFQENF
jgi:ABC-type phosphate transport system substrate-binding protein